jgi:hypothetical protein
LGAGVFAFLVAVLLLESGGLKDWAERLEVGPERAIALPVAQAVHHAVEGLGLEGDRRHGLVELSRIGWNDDPATAAKSGEAGVAAISPSTDTPSTDTSMPSGIARSPQDDGVPGGNAGVRPVERPLQRGASMRLQPMAGNPPLLSRLPEIPAVEAGKTRTVALVGDSMMAVGLSSMVLREATRYKDLTIVKTFKSGTGLARPEVFDWQTEYPAMLRDAKPDVVVVAIGANDGQGFVEDGVIYAFGSDGWKRIYQARVQSFLAMLEVGGATVVWVGLPPMKSDAYDERIALVNRIDYAVVHASPQAVWFSTAALVGDESGRFQDFGTVHGQMARLRQPDGIHLSDDGAWLVVAKLLPWLARQDVAAVESSTRPSEAGR